MGIDLPKANIPEGKFGRHRISKGTITEEQANASRWDYLASGNPERHIPAGTYTRLLRDADTVVMSDTPWELSFNREVVFAAEGDVLINGLGLGTVIDAVCAKDEVRKVTVVEISEDVIQLVWPHIRERHGDRVELVHADALEWRPVKGKKYGAVWHDIWDVIDLDNWPQITRLNRSYGQRARFQSYWGKDYIEQMKREEARYRW
jgi:hypothetical protein